MSASYEFICRRANIKNQLPVNREWRNCRCGERIGSMQRTLQTFLITFRRQLGMLRARRSSYSAVLPGALGGVPRAPRGKDKGTGTPIKVGRLCSWPGNA